MKKIKFTSDSMLYFRYRSKKETHYYAIPVNQLRRIRIQTNGTIATRIIVSLLETPLLLFNPGLISTWFQPYYKDIDIPEWNVIVTRL